MKNKTVGLAFGGGGARGLAHLQAIYAFEDLDIRPTIISGTSIGGIFAVFYAAGYSADQILALVESLVKSRFRLFADFLRANPSKTLQNSDFDSFRLGEFDLERALSVVLPPDFPERFEDLKTPVKVVATNYYGQKDAVFSTGPLLPALAASAAIPAIFHPVIIDSKVYIDGSTSNPVPFDIISGEAEIIVGVNVIGQSRGNHKKRPRKVDVLTSSNYIMQQAIVDEKERQYRPDYIARTNIHGVKIVDFTKIHMILENSKSMRCDIKEHLAALLEKETV